MLLGTICGVDFSGAELAGRNTWVARLAPGAHRRAIMRNAGGDALDALIAAIGAARA